MSDDTDGTAHAENRRLAAIMFTDIVDFSRQMGADEARTMRLLALHNQVIQHAATAHKGTVIKTVGDAFLIDFPPVEPPCHGIERSLNLRRHGFANNLEFLNHHDGFVSLSYTTAEQNCGTWRDSP